MPAEPQERRTSDDVLRDVREILARKPHGVVCFQPNDVALLVAEIDVLRAGATWRPIASAPRDGTKVIVRQSATLFSEEAVSWDEGYNGWRVDDTNLVYGSAAFDEWLPIPGAAEREATATAAAQAKEAQDGR